MKKIIIYCFFVISLGLLIKGWSDTSFSLLTLTLSDKLLAIGRLLGLCAVYCALLQILFIGRTPWLENLIGFDRLTKLHHWNGYASISFILLHPFFIIYSYALSGRKTFIDQFLDLFSHNSTLCNATLAVTIFCIIVFLSLYIVKKHLPYELWYGIHLLTYLAILLSWAHQLELGGDFLLNTYFTYYWYFLYIFVFSHLLLFRFLRPLYLFYTHRFYVQDIIKETSDTYSLYISGKNIEKFLSYPGQFIIVRFLTKNFWWQAHPFSLSYLPKKNTLRITIKNSGDFTSQIAKISLRTPILIDGPYGHFTPLLATQNKILFIAGGVGITPIRSLIEDMGKDRDIILLYCNKQDSDIIFKKELDSLASTYSFPIHNIISQQPTYKGEKGRVDTENLQRLVPDFATREIYICGPQAMTQSLCKTLKKLKITSSHIHYEEFML